MSKLQVVSELWLFMKENKKYWLAPIIFTLVLVGALSTRSFRNRAEAQVVSILGSSAFYNDSAACLLVDGEIVAAAQEERFTRVKHDYNFPLHAARYCLSVANLDANNLDYVGFYDKPLLKFDRLLETYLDYAPAGFQSFLKSMPLWMKQKLWMPGVQNRAGKDIW